MSCVPLTRGRGLQGYVNILLTSYVDTPMSFLQCRKMLCTFCSRPAVTTCESGCGQRFCDYAEHQEVHRDARGQCHPFVVKEADGVGR